MWQFEISENGTLLIQTKNYKQTTLIKKYPAMWYEKQR